MLMNDEMLEKIGGKDIVKEIKAQTTRTYIGIKNGD